MIKGIATVSCDQKTFTLSENQSTYIPSGSIHRLANDGDTTLELIEVQSGDYLEENDIIRFDDDYGR